MSERHGYESAGGGHARAHCGEQDEPENVLDPPERSPLAGEPEWPLPGGGQLHNTGSWVFSPAFQIPDSSHNPYWPGVVTWVEESGPPRRVQVLADRAPAEMAALVGRA